ncbi:hypothetical protein DICVIV_09560 [Dictyocaulus viviparus]|uniref:YhhN-like protein n=1 Tax=Dictyocaulus viviparus TaxID=29172 RepID=A0A0D8XPX1_DICVI|nr:hypothetical protein DICVIV_09560 [Dictyocaulus viviparus]
MEYHNKNKIIPFWKHKQRTARTLAIYGGTTFLVYVETEGFRKITSAMMYCLPLLALSFLSLTSSMQPRARFSTAAAFAILALSRYMLLSKFSWELMMVGYMLITIGNLMYLYSFLPLIEEWSIALSIFGTMFFCTLSYNCFADLFVSIPFLVILHTCAFASSCTLVVASGSVCMNTMEPDYEVYQASYARLAGSVALLGSNAMFLLSLFGRRVETLQAMSRAIYYAAEGLLFLANERTF